MKAKHTTTPLPLRLTGKRIAELRKKIGFSAARFARRIGVSGNTVYRWEASKGPIKLQARPLKALHVLLARMAPRPKQAEAISSRASGPKASGPKSYSAKIITSLRKGIGLSAAKFAKRIGVSENTVYRWEASKTPIQPQKRALRSLHSLQGRSGAGTAPPGTAPKSKASTPSRPPLKSGDSYSARIIASLRKGLGLSAARFAKRIGVSENTVYRWEASKTPIQPRRRPLAALRAAQSRGVPTTPAKLAVYTGKAIARLRQQIGLSAAKFAKRIGVSENTIYRWEASKRPFRPRSTLLSSLRSEQASLPPGKAPSLKTRTASKPAGKPAAYTGKSIARLREQIGLSAAKFAKRIGVSENTIYRWEASKRPFRPRSTLLSSLRSEQASLPPGKAPSLKTRTASKPAGKPAAYTGKAIARLRQQIGLSAAKFAKRIGVSENTIYRWEASKRSFRPRSTLLSSLRSEQASLPPGKAPSLKTRTASKPVGKPAGKPAAKPAVYTGKAIARLREQTGLSAAKFAKRIGVSENTIYRWEASKRRFRPRSTLLSSLRSEQASPPPGKAPSLKTRATSKPAGKPVGKPAGKPAAYTGKAIARLREQTGLSAAKFAKRIGVSENTIYRWEASKRPFRPQSRTQLTLRLLRQKNAATS